MKKKTMQWIFLFSAFIGLGSTAYSATHSACVVLSDIHFNPFLSCQDKAPCSLAQTLNAADILKWDSIFKAEAQPAAIYRKETGVSLLNSTLAKASQIATEKKASFVLITGDFIAHDYKTLYRQYTGDFSSEGYHSFVKKTFQFLANNLHGYFKNRPVYVVIGNNDAYGGDYFMHPGDVFFQESAQIWAPFLQDKTKEEAFKNTFAAGGYYAVSLPGEKNQELIILNSVLYSNKVFGLTAQHGAEVQTAWLKSHLEDARKNHRKVWIAMHIPMGIDVYSTVNGLFKRIAPFWQASHNQDFLSLVQEYSEVITAVFSAHTHMDGFAILNEKENKPIVNTTIPSVSPIFGNNPAFKVYEYDNASFELENYTAYYLSLEGTHSPVGWQLEYSFNQIYQPDCQHCRLLIGMQKLKNDRDLIKQYWHFFASSHDLSQPINDHWSPYYFCGLSKTSYQEYKSCIA